VFTGGWTVDAAAQVAGLTEDAALELSEALARHSLIYADGGPGSRSRMLETIRAFVAEQLAARPDAGQIRRRHAGYYRMLAEQADPALRGDGHGPWLERLAAETGNLAAAIRWYLGHDRGPLPHLLRVLWPFWFLRDPLSEARTWIGQLWPAAGALSPRARAELTWTAAVTALEVGDDSTALAARQQLAALPDLTGDPFLHAVSQLAIAWATPPAAATTPSAICRRSATSPTGSTAPGWPPGPASSWAPSPSCRAGSIRPGNCSMTP